MTDETASENRVDAVGVVAADKTSSPEAKVIDLSTHSSADGISLRKNFAAEHAALFPCRRFVKMERRVKMADDFDACDLRAGDSGMGAPAAIAATGSSLMVRGAAL